MSDPAEQQLPRYVCIVDCETTGLDPGKHVVIEVAGVLFDLHHRTVRAAYSTLIRQMDAVRHGNPAQKWNGIDPAMLDHAPPAEGVWEQMAAMLHQGDLVLAHRAAFDRGFFPRTLRTVRPWTCSKYGVRWPKGPYGGHLVELAQAFDPAAHQEHRALGDCMLLARVLQLAGTPGHGAGFDVARALWEARGITEPRPEHATG